MWSLDSLLRKPLIFYAMWWRIKIEYKVEPGGTTPIHPISVVHKLARPVGQIFLSVSSGGHRPSFQDEAFIFKKNHCHGNDTCLFLFILNVFCGDYMKKTSNRNQKVPTK